MELKSINELVLHLENKVEDENNSTTTMQFFNDNFDKLERIIVCCGSLKEKFNGKTAYELIADVVFEEGIKTKNGRKLSTGYVSRLMNIVRSRRGLAKTKTVPLAVNCVIPDVPKTSKTELKSFADAVDLVLDEVQSKELHMTNYQYINGNLVNIEKIIGLSKHLNYQFNGVSVYDFISDIAFNNGFKGNNGKKMQVPYLRRMIKLARQNRNSRESL